MKKYFLNQVNHLMKRDDFDDEDEEPSLDDLEFPDDLDDMEGEGEE